MLMRWRCSALLHADCDVLSAEKRQLCSVAAPAGPRLEQRARQESQDLQHVVLRPRGPWLMGLADTGASQFQLRTHSRAVLSHVGLHGFSPFIFETLRCSYFIDEVQTFHQHKEYKTERSGRDERNSVTGYRDGQHTTSDRSTCTARAP